MTGLLYQPSTLEEEKRLLELDKCAADPFYFIENYLYIFEPRAKYGEGWKLFKLWPRQKEYILFLEAQYVAGKGVVAEKCRDLGGTIATLAWIFWRWRFRSSFTALLGSLNKEMVQKLVGDPDPLLSKIDAFVTKLPEWMLPKGFVYDMHSRVISLVNPENDSNITGAPYSDDFGLGKRKSVILIDEYADWKFSVTGNCRFTTNTIIRLSTVKGENHFTRESDAAKLSGEQFIFEWWQNPLHTQKWFEEEEAADTSGGVDFARFVLRDRTATPAEKVYLIIRQCPVGKFERNPKLPLIEFVDVGLADETYIGWLQVDIESPSRGLYLIDELIAKEQDPTWFVPFFGKILYPNPYTYTDEQEEQQELHRLWGPSLITIGDPSGNHREWTSKRSGYDDWRDHGIDPKCDAKLYKNRPLRIKAMRAALKRLFIADHCMVFRDRVRKLKFPEIKPGSERTTELLTPVHDENSHPATAFEFFSISEYMIDRTLARIKAEQEIETTRRNPWATKMRR